MIDAKIIVETAIKACIGIHVDDLLPKGGKK